MATKDKDLAPVTKGFAQKTFNRIIAAINRNRVLPVRPGWEQTPEGIIPPPFEVGGAGGGGPKYWTLEIVDGAANEVRIKYPGSLSKNDDIDEAAEISIDSIDDILTVAEDEYIVIKIDEDLGAELLNEDEWTDHPWPYETETESDTYEVFKSYRIPLYKIIALPEELNPVDEIAINENLAAKRMVPNSSLALVITFTENEDGQTISVPKAYTSFTLA